MPTFVSAMTFTAFAVPEGWRESLSYFSRICCFLVSYSLGVIAP
jgi:hypothetical protein